MDVRFKLIILLGGNLAVTQAGYAGLACMGVIQILLLRHLRIPTGRFLNEIKMFLVLLLLVFVARSISEPGRPVFSWQVVVVTSAGLFHGGLICLRLMHVVLLGLFFIRSSRPWEIKTAIHWFLAPVPGVPANRISLMISLMFRFIPLVLEQVSEISEAQQARAVGLRKNPVFRMKILVIPLLENSFKKADEMVMAMESRCYSDTRTDPTLQSGKSDWLVLALSGALGTFVVII